MNKQELERSLRKEQARLRQERGKADRLQTMLLESQAMVNQLNGTLRLAQGQVAAREEQHEHLGRRIRELLRNRSGELQWEISVALTEVGL